MAWFAGSGRAAVCIGVWQAALPRRLQVVCTFWQGVFDTPFIISSTRANKAHSNLIACVCTTFIIFITVTVSLLTVIVSLGWLLRSYAFLPYDTGNSLQPAVKAVTFSPTYGL
jgi:uncharacterized membrane protein AbrB (regulator of aidB expression)